jgi:hypothetical protein
MSATPDVAEAEIFAHLQIELMSRSLRVRSIKASLDASTVTPGNTAPDKSKACDARIERNEERDDKNSVSPG